MNWDAVGAIAEVVAVLGVVASLVFVGIQIRQNTVQLRQDNLRETIRGTLDTNWYFHRDDAAFEVFRQGCNSFEELSGKDKAHFHSILVDLSFYLEVTRGLHQAELIDSAALEINERFFLAILCTPGGLLNCSLGLHSIGRQDPLQQSGVPSVTTCRFVLA